MIHASEKNVSNLLPENIKGKEDLGEGNIFSLNKGFGSIEEGKIQTQGTLVTAHAFNLWSSHLAKKKKKSQHCISVFLVYAKKGQAQSKIRFSAVGVTVLVPVSTSCLFFSVMKGARDQAFASHFSRKDK